MLNPLVSIIMAAFNSEVYISESIKSVVDQSYSNWELLIINDGSSDNTLNVSKSFSDSRIRIFDQKNMGVSAARNVGLINMTGQYLCFLDADDVMSKNSIKSRMNIFHQYPDISFIDGIVIYMNDDMTPTGKKYIPSFNGYPYDELLQLNRSCYFGNTWMIKWEKYFNYRFSEKMTHAEDLFFYLNISKGRKYSFTKNPVLYYRRRNNSAMNDLVGLEQGYLTLLTNIRQELRPNPTILSALKRRIIRIMFLSHLFDGRNPYSAVRSIFRFFTET